MKKTNINSREWCDIIFKDRNKEYGAYKFRQDSSRHHLIAFLLIIVFTILATVIIYLLSPRNQTRDEPALKETIVPYE